MISSRRATRPLLYLGAAVVLFYLAGGMDAYRWARARIRAAMQPPTAEQMALPPLPPPPPLRGALPPEAVRGKMWLSDPPRPVTVAIVISVIIVSAMVLMYFTGRVAPSHRATRRG